MQYGTIIAVSGAAGSGKNTLVNHAREIYPHLGWAVSCTTRLIRPGEEHGKNYFYLTDQEFDDKIAAKEFAEWAHVHGKRYGVPLSELKKFVENGQDVILDINIEGADSLRNHLDTIISQNLFSVFILTPSLDVLRERMTTRGGMEPEEIERRLTVVSQEEARAPFYDGSLVNDRLDDAKNDIVEIIRRGVIEPRALRAR